MKYDRKTYIDFTSFVVSDRSMIWYYIKNFTKPFLWNEFKDLTPYKLGRVRSVILHNEITFKDEVEEQSNFPDYAPLHIQAILTVEVTIIKFAEAPTGVGELGLSSTSPAVANAILAISGKRITELLLSKSSLEFV